MNNETPIINQSDIPKIKKPREKNSQNENSILLAGFLLYLVFFVYFLYSMITFSYISNVFKTILIIFFGIGTLLLFVSIKSIRDKNKRTAIIKILIAFCAIWIAFQFLIIAGVQYEYSKLSENYSNSYNDYLTEHPADYLNASWDVTEEYQANYKGTYDQITGYIPNRNLFVLPFVTPILVYYMDNMNGFQKLIVIQQTGNCGEFTQSITFLLNDTTKLPTRMIYFEGIDHMMPEVEINNQWWVFDRIYLTQSNPIISNDMSYIPDDVRNNISFIYSSSNKESLLKQHGFNETNITITIFADIPGNVWNGKSIKGVTVEVFSMNNSHDPLVSKGITNENGQYSTVLNSDKDYLIFAHYESNLKLVGLASLSKIVSDNLSVNMSITNYA